MMENRDKLHHDDLLQRAVEAVLRDPIPDEAPPERIAQLMAAVRQAADHMVNHSIGRLPVVSRERPHRLIGIITRSDILSVFQKRLKEAQPQKPTLGLFKGNGKKPAKPQPV